MTRHENILSFDEARARGIVSSRGGVKQTPSPSQKSHKVPPVSHQAYRSAQPRTAQQMSSAQGQRAHTPNAHQPQHLTYDPTFEQSFTATARSGTYSQAHRPHPANAQRSGQMPATRPSTSARFAAQKAVQHPVPKNAPVRTAAVESEEDQAAACTGKNDKKSFAHRVRSAKAERQFNKTFGSDEPVKPGPEQTSRAAVYEMKMGKSHKRSTRMQNNASSKKKRGLLSRFFSLFAFLDPRSPRFSSQALIACATVVLAVVMLYNPVANYYQEVRSQQQLEAEYAVVADYYSDLKSEVEYLNTKEGLEEYVREELGWVKGGEKVSSVDGLEPRDATVKQGSITADLSNAVPTPVTWYSPVLDVIFGYNKP